MPNKDKAELTATENGTHDKQFIYSWMATPVSLGMPINGRTGATIRKQPTRVEIKASRTLNIT